jgi:hypothetical protein
MGLASVSIYSAIVAASRPDQFFSRSMIYLIAMQVGNALGIQAVGVAELRHAGALATALLVAALPALLLAWVRFGQGRAPGLTEG